MTEPPDDLARLLGPTPAGVSPDEARRANSLAATSRVLNWSRAVRRLAVVAGAVTLFAAGGLVGWVAKPVPNSVEVTSPVASSLIPPSEEVEPLSAERLELNAELSDDPTDAARLYREAGDRFLTNRDYENAARCYRRHLSVADDDARKVSTSDSWLLLTMKVR